MLCAGLVSPAIPAESDAWVKVRPRPRDAVIYGGAVVVGFELANTRDRKIRVRHASALVFAGDRVVESVRFDRAFFNDDRHRRPTVLEPGRSVHWQGICIGDLPPGADRLRLELELVAPRGADPRRAESSVEVTLRRAPDPVLLQLPFAGYWRVTQGHDCASLHRVGGHGGDLAWDFAAVGPEGRSAKRDYRDSRRNADTYSFGQPVLAPVAGTVVRVVDDVRDNEGLKTYPNPGVEQQAANPAWASGNFVVLDAGRGAFVLLGHLQYDSIRVRPGDVVQAGMPIARCGNSGNTFEPHLHVQVMDRADPADPEVRGLPAAFEDYVEFTMAGNGDSDLLARRVPRGDPAPGSVVAGASADGSSGGGGGSPSGRGQGDGG